MKTNLIVLAAGNSTRFKANKLLYLMNGQPMVVHIFREIKSLSLHRVIVVTQYDEIMEYAKAYGYDVVYNNNADLGISHSIQLALDAEEVEQYIFMVGDQPYTTRNTLQRLMDYSDGKHIICTSDGKALKNPVLFPNSYRDELLSLQGDQGGKSIVNKYIHLVKTIYVDEKELQDIDTVKDVNKY